MTYNFDQVIDRKGTGSLKYDCAAARQVPEDCLPLWVADQDFRCPPCVSQALIQRAEHGIFGYTEPDQGYYEALRYWFSRRWQWQPDLNGFVQTPGVVFALAMAVRAFTQPGDAVLIQTPVYYPFTEVILDNNRRLVTSPLSLRDGHYEMDFVSLRRQLETQQVKLLFLCNPHNPVGRVWTATELRQLGDLCARYQVKIVADEIHADFVYAPAIHRSFLTVNPNLAEQTMVCTAPSKTFNLAGLQIANIYLPGQAMRTAFKHEVNAAGYSQANCMGLIACKACYSAEGEAWLEELKLYLQDNIAYIDQFVAQNLPELAVIKPEGTYLLWLDCRKLNLEGTELRQFMRQQAKLWLDDGFIFGQGGEGFVRLNIACPKATLTEAMRRLQTACQQLR
ncbi:MAG: pyridoxal phosphate-dependent aminotransferase [Oscillospiraceae bacterium]|nr:pyridoxal phosphate-dependent aminotransferase [Oscillospiraceae bacterium]MDD4367982.1 pyridoxal phosphate-dependent aminotransferase [Oscillospiraceae bacterium]